MLGRSYVAAQLVTFQEGLSSMKLMKTMIIKEQLAHIHESGYKSKITTILPFYH
jgi:hypothetical protein